MKNGTNKSTLTPTQQEEKKENKKTTFLTTGFLSLSRFALLWFEQKKSFLSAVAMRND